MLFCYSYYEWEEGGWFWFRTTLIIQWLGNGYLLIIWPKVIVFIHPLIECPQWAMYLAYYTVKHDHTSTMSSPYNPCKLIITHISIYTIHPHIYTSTHLHYTKLSNSSLPEPCCSLAAHSKGQLTPIHSTLPIFTV